MMHERRKRTVCPAASVEDLAHKLTQHEWAPNTGFELEGYLFLNDSTGSNSAQAYAIVKRSAEKTGPLLQVESITFGRWSYENALKHIQRALAGEYDNSQFTHKVELTLEPAFRSLERYVAYLKDSFYLRTNAVHLLPEKEAVKRLLPRISLPGHIREVTEDTYRHFLEALPPKWIVGSDFCFAEGTQLPRLFWREKGRCFARQLGRDEWKAFGEIAKRQEQDPENKSLTETRPK
jgi:hypothetical protein